MRELAETVIAPDRLEIADRFKPLPADDPRQRQPDIAAAQATLGWEPEVALEEGLGQDHRLFRAALAGERG